MTKPKRQSDNALRVHLLLDASGSMSTHRHNVIKGANAFVEQLKSGIMPARITITKFCFDSARDMVEDVPVYEAPTITIADYAAGGGTPLYKCLRRAIETLDKRNGIKVVVVITDGADSGGGQPPKAEIEVRRKAGWLFLYMGAGMRNMARDYGEEYSVKAQSKKVGIPPEAAVDLTKDNLELAMATAAQIAMRFVGGLDAAFTKEERDALVAKKKKAVTE